MKKRMNRDRKQQVETTRLNHGPDHYEKIGAKSATFQKDPKLAVKAAMMRWHPTWFNDEGEYIGEENVNNS